MRSRFSHRRQPRKSRFVEMFGDVNGSRYAQEQLGTLCEVTSGGTPDRHNSSYWDGGTIPWVKTTELHNSLISDTEEKITLMGLNGSSAKLVPAGTILIAMYGQGRTRGMTGMLSIEASTNQACACILPSDKIDRSFLWRYLVLSYDRIRALAQGAGQPNLNGKQVKEFPVPLPPLSLQREFAAFVAKVDKLEFDARKRLETARKIYRAKLQEFFG